MDFHLGLSTATKLFAFSYLGLHCATLSFGGTQCFDEKLLFQREALRLQERVTPISLMAAKLPTLPQLKAPGPGEIRSAGEIMQPGFAKYLKPGKRYLYIGAREGVGLYTERFPDVLPGNVAPDENHATHRTLIARLRDILGKEPDIITAGEFELAEVHTRSNRHTVASFMSNGSDTFHPTTQALDFMWDHLSTNYGLPIVGERPLGMGSTQGTPRIHPFEVQSELGNPLKFQTLYSLFTKNKPATETTPLIRGRRPSDPHDMADPIGTTYKNVKISAAYLKLKTFYSKIAQSIPNLIAQYSNPIDNAEAQRAYKTRLGTFDSNLISRDAWKRSGLYMSSDNAGFRQYVDTFYNRCAESGIEGGSHFLSDPNYWNRLSGRGAVEAFPINSFDDAAQAIIVITKRLIQAQKEINAAAAAKNQP